MKSTEAAALLTVAAAFDNRKPDPDAAKAWALALDGLRFDDCRDAIVAHYRKSREWIMPSDVIAGVNAIRTKRVKDYGPLPAPDHLDPDAEDFDQQYSRYIRESNRAIADGEILPGQPLFDAPAIEASPRDVASLGQIGRSVPRA